MVAPNVEDVARVIISRRVGKGIDEIKLYDHQLKMFSAFDDLVNGNKRVVFLKAPCGSGKTEAFVIPYLAQFALKDIRVPKFIYTLPTQTLVHNMKARLSSYLQVLSDHYEEFKKYSNSNSLEPEVEYGLDLDPKYLVPRFTIATYDVLIYAWFARRTIPWRPFTTRGAILSSIIVFDEAHLIQDLYFYSQHLFTKFIEVLAMAGAPVVVSSATLPDEVVNSVKDSLGSGIEVIATSTYGKGKLSIIEFPQHDEAVQIKAAMDRLYEIVMEGVRESKDVLIVVNSVKVAFEIYHNLKERIKNGGSEIVEVYDSDSLLKQIEKRDGGRRVLICLLHGRLPVGVRARREGLFEILRGKRNELKQKGVEKKWSIVVVATQVAEVGIDYSFDIVITEIAPLTAVIQRLMRAGREERQEAKAYILPPITTEDSERVPSYTIYSRGLIDYALTNCSRLVNGNLNDIDFLTSVANDEYRKIKEFSERYEGIVEFRKRAESLLFTSLYLPPLASSVQRNIMSSFKARLGEYVYLYVLREKIEGNPIDGIKKLELLLNKMDKEDIVKGAIRFNIRIHKEEREERKQYVAEMPREALWHVGEDIRIIYISSFEQEPKMGRTASLKSLRLRAENGRIVTSLSDLEEIYGKILVLRPIPDLKPEYGLIRCDYERIYITVR